MSKDFPIYEGAREAFVRCYAAESPEVREQLLQELEQQNPELGEEVRALLKGVAAGAIINQAFGLGDTSEPARTPDAGASNADTRLTSASPAIP